MVATKHICQIPNANDLLRFWSRVDKNGPIPEHMPHLGPCWVWTAGKSRGYGKFYINSVHSAAHHVAWIIQNGPVPIGTCVCHKCDNPCCCRADHLFIGTPKDNFDDAVKKGRIVALKGGPAPVECRRRGEANAAAKLTADDVQRIRILLASRRPSRSIAKDFGVSQGTVQWIKKGTTWKHV